MAQAAKGHLIIETHGNFSVVNGFPIVCFFHKIEGNRVWKLLNFDVVFL